MNKSHITVVGVSIVSVSVYASESVLEVGKRIFLRETKVNKSKQTVKAINKKFKCNKIVFHIYIYIYINEDH